MSSSKDSNKSKKTPSNNEGRAPSATIKLAAKEASKRAASNGNADPGPGDPGAEPSEAPVAVDIPEPPTDSQLIAKSSNSRKIVTLKEAKSISRAPSTMTPADSKISGSNAGPAASQPSMGADPPPAGKEATTSKHLSGPSQKSSASGGGGGQASVQMSGGQPSGGAASTGAQSVGQASKQAASQGASQAASQSGSQGSSQQQPLASARQSVSQAATGSQVTSPTTASVAMKGETGQHETEEDVTGEGEMEASPSPAPSGAAAAASGKQANVSSSAAEPSVSGKTSPAASTASNKSTTSHKSTASNKKVTKFRYHKRVVVRTKGKTSPAKIMNKVNKRDHQAGLTASTIEDMDPEELMRRAGIKGTRQTHWRVRLRQTKRVTKNGKTTTQTKVAYRDSEGHKHVKLSAEPDCKKCGKKLEMCRCDEEK